ncbi:bifunctional RecB family nuclease/DEAD/DEAH box helicase [Natronorubrum halophilum]|uniref:bifunctional RecB family nuclease/DEAD/DEAH box helicase n=1 Tax=Natronorubrum halophilum TaxID=1702106 RepID=UPI0010C1A442|nr:AAA domain-containing protein [Natronorubrum halophilum]
MPDIEYAINVNQIGEYIRHRSCPRRFKLEYNDRELAMDLPFSEALFNPLDPVLQQKGRTREDEWERIISDGGFSKIEPDSMDGSGGENCENDGLTGEETIAWSRFLAAAADTSPGEKIYAREVSVTGDIGVFEIDGIIDFLLLYWDDDNEPVLRIVETKASRKDKTYHRTQVATYRILIENHLREYPTNVGGSRLMASNIQAVVGRIDEETNTVQDILGMEAFDLETERSDIKELTAETGRLRKIVDSDLDELNYQLDSKCDSCVFDVHCFPESARQNALEIVGINPTETRTLREHGVTDVDSLADLDLESETAENIRHEESFTSSLQTLTERAAARRQNLPGDSPDDEYPVAPYTHNGGSQLPERMINGERLIRVYLNVDYDYTENRIAGLSAHVTTSQGDIETPFKQENGDWKPDPVVQEEFRGKREVQGETITAFQTGPWSGKFDTDTGSERRIITDFLDQLYEEIRMLTEADTAPIHFYVWSESEISNLIEACARGGSELLGQLRQLLGCREPTEQLIYSSVRQEVDSRFGLGWTGRGLVVASSMPWFGESYHWTREIRGKRVKLDSIFNQSLFDFKTELRLGPENDWISRSDAEATSEKFEIHSRFFDSLPAPYWYAYWNELPDPSTVDDSKVAQAIEDYNGLDSRMVLEGYLEARVHALRWIEDRIRFRNEDLSKPSLDVTQLRNFSLDVEGAAGAALDFLSIDHHSGVTEWLTTGLQPPTHRSSNGSSIPISNIRVGPDRIVRADINLSGHDVTADILRDRVAFSEESFVRVSPCFEDQRKGQTPGQLLEAGRTCVIDNINWNARTVRMELIPSGKSQRYRLASYYAADEHLFDRATIDESVSNYVASRVHDKIEDGRGNHAHRWFDPEEPRLPPYEAAENEENSELRDVLERFDIGGGDSLLESQIDVILEGVDTRTQLIHGPPGTGKTTAIALASLLRSIADLQAGDIAYISASTHTAVDNLINRIDDYTDSFTRLCEQLDIDTTEISLVRVDDNERSDPNERVQTIETKGVVRQLDEIRDGSITFVGGTVNGLLKLDDTLSGSQTFGGDNREFYSPLLIIDEASMMVFPYFLALAELTDSDTGRFLVSGDHRQLSPILSHDWDEEDRPPVEKYQPFVSAFEAIRTLSAEADLTDKSVTESALRHTFRLPPDVRRLISRLYESRDGFQLEGKELEPNTSEVQTEFNPLRQVWDEETGLYLLAHDEDESRQSNNVEAAIIDRLLTEAEGLSDDSVAILSPHRAQRTLLQNRLEGHDAADSIRVIDTVERLQGGECENVIVSATASDPQAIVQNEEFLLDLNRANVAFSRAKNRLFVVCSNDLLNHVAPDIEQYESSMLWKSLRQYCRERVGSLTIGGHELRVQTVPPEEQG